MWTAKANTDGLLYVIKACTELATHFGDDNKNGLVWFGLVWFYGTSTTVGY